MLWSDPANLDRVYEMAEVTAMLYVNPSGMSPTPEDSSRYSCEYLPDRSPSEGRYVSSVPESMLAKYASESSGGAGSGMNMSVSSSISAPPYADMILPRRIPRDTPSKKRWLMSV